MNNQVNNSVETDTMVTEEQKVESSLDEKCASIAKDLNELEQQIIKLKGLDELGLETTEEMLNTLSLVVEPITEIAMASENVVMINKLVGHDLNHAINDIFNSLSFVQLSKVLEEPIVERITKESVIAYIQIAKNFIDTFRHGVDSKLIDPKSLTDIIDTRGATINIISDGMVNFEEIIFARTLMHNAIGVMLATKVDPKFLKMDIVYKTDSTGNRIIEIFDNVGLIWPEVVAKHIDEGFKYGESHPDEPYSFPAHGLTMIACRVKQMGSDGNVVIVDNEDLVKMEGYQKYADSKMVRITLPKVG